MKSRNQCRNLVEILEFRAELHGDRPLYQFYKDSQMAESTLTFQELSQKSMTLAYHLRPFVKPGDRVLINHQPGLDYICSFFACLIVGVLAVTVYPPRFNQKQDRLKQIIKDSEPKAALTSNSVLELLSQSFSTDLELKNIHWISTDEVWKNQKVERIPPTPSEIAFLQYTSGSTSSPKGVMLTHENLISNLKAIEEKFKINPESRGASWLPPYHDMGLIGGILSPFFCGIPVGLMSPFSFLQRPQRWLELISKTQATISGGPNFAFELCQRRVSEEQMQNLDLSSWQVAFCGAEPIRPKTLQLFADKFSRTGFQWKNFLPCYGLAEATLMVTAESPPQIHHFSDHRQVVSSGSVSSLAKICIVDPDSGEICEEEKEGEILVAGSSVAAGYWQQPQATEETFCARVRGEKDHFLRTGDLGFFKQGQLFVTGRIKDLLIFRGANFYPQDLEECALESHPELGGLKAAAFSLFNSEGLEELGLAVEVSRSFKQEDFEKLAGQISSCLLESHGIQPQFLSLVRAHSLPLTSSGKIQRQLIRQRVMENQWTDLFSVRTKA